MVGLGIVVLVIVLLLIFIIFFKNEKFFKNGCCVGKDILFIMWIL